MAWEGAFGVVPPECDGCVVSTEFPVFEVLQDQVFPEVLDTYFRNLIVWPEISGASTGTNVRGDTKSLKIWTDNAGIIPANFKLTASRGGLWDHLIDRYGLKEARVVFSIAQAQALGLEIDHDDSHAFGSDKSFALRLHGTQAKGSPAAKALSALKTQGWNGYSQTRKAA
jgi:hypothetical protein